MIARTGVPALGPRVRTDLHEAERISGARMGPPATTCADDRQGLTSALGRHPELAADQ